MQIRHSAVLALQPCGTCRSRPKKLPALKCHSPLLIIMGGITLWVELRIVKLSIGNTGRARNHSVACLRHALSVTAIEIRDNDTRAGSRQGIRNCFTNPRSGPSDEHRLGNSA